MHELGLAMEVVELVSERCAGARVTKVVLEVGMLAAVLPDALEMCFGLAAEGTPVEGAHLEIVQTPGKARCAACAGVVVLMQPLGQCACGGIDLEWTEGFDLRVREMEVA
jgi:hydrogenase nickel incorporation protein HypA/HybF